MNQKVKMAHRRLTWFMKSALDVKSFLDLLSTTKDYNQIYFCVPFCLKFFERNQKHKLTSFIFLSILLY